MKTAKVVLGILLGSIFAISGGNGIAILLSHAYWSFAYTLTFTAISMAISAVCFWWAVRTAGSRSTQSHNNPQPPG